MDPKIFVEAPANSVNLSANKRKKKKKLVEL
jgi:hypothetical protein